MGAPAAVYLNSCWFRWHVQNAVVSDLGRELEFLLFLPNLGHARRTARLYYKLEMVFLRVFFLEMARIFFCDPFVCSVPPSVLGLAGQKLCSIKTKTRNIVFSSVGGKQMAHVFVAGASCSVSLTSGYITVMA